jgi:hypothetical protein
LATFAALLLALSLAVFLLLSLLTALTALTALLVLLVLIFLVWHFHYSFAEWRKRMPGAYVPTQKGFFVAATHGEVEPRGAYGLLLVAVANPVRPLAILLARLRLAHILPIDR